MGFDVSSIQNNFGLLNDAKTATDKNQNESTKLFDDFYNAALGLYEDVNTKEKTVQQLQIDYVSGKSDDYLGMLLAQEKANTTLQFTIQVTNKIIEAYKEIMRLQV